MIRKIKQLMRKLIPIKIQTSILNIMFEGKMFIPGDATYNQDGLITKHSSDFMKEENFKRSYELAVKLGIDVDANIHWRAHVAC